MSKRSPKQVTPPEPQEIDLLSGQRQKSESDKSVIACNEWLRLGPGRSLSALLEKLTDTNQLSPITSSIGTLKQWSMTYEWAARAVDYDAGWESRKNAEREAVLGYGLAHDYERVRKLYRLAAMLEAQIYERGLYGDLHNLWVPDVKSIGSGEFAERVDIERFNSALIEQYRKVLEDIAKETGGRVQKQELKVDDWRSQAIADIRAGKIAYEVLANAFDHSLAAELFAAAGVPISTGTDNQT